MRIDAITKREEHLIGLYTAAKEASTQLQEAIKTTAVIADTSPAVVRRYIAEKANAIIGETEQLRHQKLSALDHALTPLLTPQQVASYLGWSVATVYTQANKRKLPFVKVGRSLRFRRSDIEALLIVHPALDEVRP